MIVFSYGGIDIGTTLVIGLCEHTHHGEEDLFHRLDGTPSLTAAFVHVGIISRWVQDADANTPIGIDIGMVYAGGEAHLRGTQRVVFGECEHGRK